MARLEPDAWCTCCPGIPTGLVGSRGRLAIVGTDRPTLGRPATSPEVHNLPCVANSGPPRDLRPMKATTSESPPVGDGWAHEVKWDGMRVLARLDGGAVT